MVTVLVVLAALLLRLALGLAAFAADGLNLHFVVIGFDSDSIASSQLAAIIVLTLRCPVVVESPARLQECAQPQPPSKARLQSWTPTGWMP